MAVDIEEYSFDLTETDRENLAQGDEKFQPHNWEDLKHIIGDIYLFHWVLNFLLFPISQQTTIYQS